MGPNPPERPSTFGLLAGYFHTPIEYPAWLCTDNGEQDGALNVDYPHILPRLGELIRELAQGYSDLADSFDPIVLQTDNRDWENLPWGDQIARTMFHRLRHTRTERWAMIRYLTSKHTAYGDRHHYWQAPILALAMHILQHEKCHILQK